MVIITTFFVGKFITKFKVRNILSPSPAMGEPNGLVTLRKGNVLVTDGAKACVHEFEASGKYCGKFGDMTDLKCPTGMCYYLSL